jgi:hypothetical protein
MLSFIKWFLDCTEPDLRDESKWTSWHQLEEG